MTSWRENFVTHSSYAVSATRLPVRPCEVNRTRRPLLVGDTPKYSQALTNSGLATPKRSQTVPTRTRRFAGTIEKAIATRHKLVIARRSRLVTCDEFQFARAATAQDTHPGQGWPHTSER